MRTIDPHNLDDAAHLAARAFHADPLFQYFFPDERARERLSFYTFRFIISHACRKGFAFAASPSLEGIAVWLGPGKIDRNRIDELRCGGLRMYLKQGREIIQRQVRASGYMKALQRGLLPERHFYLSILAVDEKHRGKGIAAALLRPMLAKADRAHLACYLDTHREANVGLYQRFGFRVARESVIPGAGVRHWAMIRDPE